ncbi:DNA-protecting protein DprA [Weissella paramesenteroides]|nr:DNA-protecting protein DprA [Weissella paramesenteroides]KAA8438675.1 DNA-protecting protein DprA [Weissella paramesenteroides]MBU7568714.1 DNA-processing protein DprA [Weissella hellenica]
MKQRDFLLWLMLVPCLTIKGRYRIWQYMDKNKLTNINIKLVLQLSRLNQEKKQYIYDWYRKKVWQRQFQSIKQCPFIAICDSQYPKYLLYCIDAPICLFYQGDLELLQQPLVAIVGARQATNYGKKILRAWIPYLVKSGLITVSGLALGIDELTHRTTLAAGGKTIGIIGTGLSCTYPKRDDLLQEKVAVNGLLLSEYLPWQGPNRKNFPERNRIIAGLSHVCIVIEAKKRSGSLITAMQALDQNRTVMAVPGRIDEQTSKGTNALILAGATPILVPQQIVLEFKNFY